jgi:hypothetical protein
MLHREGRDRAGARLFLFRGRAAARLSVITVDANGEAIVTSDNAVPTTRTSAVASLPMTTKLFVGLSDGIVESGQTNATNTHGENCCSRERPAPLGRGA